MSQKTINIGTAVGDTSATDLRTGGDNINKNFSELYLQRGRTLDLNSFVVSDTADLYAHNSQILINRLTDKTVLIVMYLSDKSSRAEWQTTQKAVLKVYELTTKTLLKSFDIFYRGLSAGLTMPNELFDAPRMYISGTNLMCVCCMPSGIYLRTIDMTNTDPSTWTAGNITTLQMTMKNSSGVDTLSDCVAANFKTHLEYVLGDTNDAYNNLDPCFRNLDRITVIGSTWYSILELTGQLHSGAYNIPVLIKSTNSGVAWQFVSLIGYTTSARNRTFEASVVAIGTDLHVIGRTITTSIAHFVSTDSGATWSAVSSLSIGDYGVLSAKPTAINYYKSDSTTKDVLLAVSLTSELTENTYRTTLGLFTTSDFVSFVEVAKIVTNSYVHYPSLCQFSRMLYLSYTKGMKFLNDTPSSGSDRDTIAVTRVY